MGWEKRGNQKFYYRTRKVNGRYVREYLGRGGRAKRVAAEDAARKEAHEKARDLRKQWESLDSQLNDLTKATTMLLKATLYGAGFHQHKREWRKWRLAKHTPQEGDISMNDADATDPISLETLVEQAQQGDVSTLPAIRELLDKMETWEDSRILAKQIERSWIKTISGQDLITQAVLDREVDALRVQLQGPNPSPLETLLIERICSCWLAIQHAELIASKRLSPHTMALSNAEENRLDKTHHRFLSAVRELAKVRKLLTPAQKLQVNIGTNQIVS